ncbi:acyltransferase family protein, partial [Citrobacter freundii]
NGGKNSLNRLIRCVCGKKIGPDPRNFNQRVSLGRNDLLIRTFPSILEVLAILSFFITVFIATNFIKDMNIKFDILFIPCMLMLVVVFAFNNGVISGWLSNKYLILLGESSFSFYMIHFIIVNKLYEIMSPSPNNFAELAGYISTALLCSVVSSVVIFKLFEMPINRFIRNKWISVRYK